MLKTCFKILMIDRSNMHLKKKSHYFWAGVYKPALCSNKISFKLRIRVFQALISSIFLYNSELWSLSKARNNEMDVFQRMFLRQIIRNRKISNNEIYKLCNIEPWSNEIKRRRLKWFGHLVRLPENVPAKQALAEARKPYQKISGGQPTTWLSTIKTDLSEMNYNLKEAFEIAYDIDIYTQLVCHTVARSHQADWRHKRRLKEETAGPGRRRPVEPICCAQSWYRKAQVTLCRSFFADRPDHSRPPRPVMIVTKPSDRGLNSRSLYVQDCQYDLSTTAVRHWYDGSVWSALSTFATTITTTTETIDTTALTMLPITPTLLPICYHD